MTINTLYPKFSRRKENDAIVRDVPVFEGQDPAGAKRQSALTANITMVICLHKCTVCGVCASLCPALTIKHRLFDPEKMSFGPTGCPAEKKRYQM